VSRGGGEREASSDIYFFEVRPFDHTYRQAESQGGQMQGQGGENRDDLSAQQRQIIAGTFNLVRDRWRYTDTEVGENLATLALAQGRAREEVATLVGRIMTRGITQMDSTFAAITEALDTAAAAMEQAEELLRAGDPQQALSPEQKALQHLQRAEAMYGETEVSQQQGGGGGGGGGENQANAEDLADLFELELDRMRNQYEEVQRGRREQADQELDEVMQRLRELARRQQQQNERMRAQQQNMQNQSGGGGGGGAEGQRRLADEAEELARQLERLSREDDRPDLEQTARDLREAADAMRQAAANARSNGVAQGSEALD
jgi:hypothetical protein